MEVGEFLRKYRKKKKLSVRAFAEMLAVSNFRLEKWERGINPNYEDEVKIRKFFGVRDLQNFSEQFLNDFEEKKNDAIEDILNLKNQLLEEKDKRIENLEETIWILKEALAEYEAKKKS